MLKKNLFRKPSIELEGENKISKIPSVPNNMMVICSSCKKTIFKNEIEENSFVCNLCGFHFRMSARNRIKMICDEGSFKELYKDMTSVNKLHFKDYSKKLNDYMTKTKENDAVICGEAKIKGERTCIFVMEHSFMMGSMGSVVGEKITRLFEYAIRKKLPVIGFTVSGGARMQEGVYSLMQMAKISAAVKMHSKIGLLYITVLTDPTTGGVTASFAMLGDIIISEPGALIGFAGPRVIEQTVNQKLPNSFQKAEFLLEKGFIDKIVNRKKMSSFLYYMLYSHKREVDL